MHKAKTFLFWLTVFGSCALLFFQSNFINRSESAALLLSFAGLIVLFGAEYFFGKKLSLIHWISAAILLRIILLGSTPWLSDDFFRFVWDGILQTLSVNPFSGTPNALTGQLDFEDQALLLEQMNSPDYHTVYPPASQFVFYVSALFSNQDIRLSVFFMKISILLMEIGSFFFLFKILKHFELPLHIALLYLLHPLVIVEFTGNLHFEAGMLFGFLGAWYFILRQKDLMAAVFLSISILFKLWPLLFLPPLFLLIDKKRAFIISSVTVLLSCIAFVPFYFQGMIQSLFSGLSLYFQHFEFHAGLHHWLKQFLDSVVGYEIRLEWMSYYNAVPLFLMAIFFWSFRKFQKPVFWGFFALGLLSIYLISGAVIHPWYMLPLIAFALPYKIKFPLVWSLFIPLTYLTYRAEPYQEIFWINHLIHLLIIGSLLWEFYTFRKTQYTL